MAFVPSPFAWRLCRALLHGPAPVSSAPKPRHSTSIPCSLPASAGGGASSAALQRWWSTCTRPPHAVHMNAQCQLAQSILPKQHTLTTRSAARTCTCAGRAQSLCAHRASTLTSMPAHHAWPHSLANLPTAAALRTDEIMPGGSPGSFLLPPAPPCAPTVVLLRLPFFLQEGEGLRLSSHSVFLIPPPLPLPWILLHLPSLSPRLSQVSFPSAG
eukprot:27097-Chlamydomonas_euryale.AAC.1